MQKQYSFLNEFVMTGLGIAATALGGVSFVNSILQSSANKKYMKNFHIALFKAETRPQALNVVNQYCTQLQQIVQKSVQNKTDKRIVQAQNYIRIHFQTPLIRIIQNQQDPYWHKNVMIYMQKNVSKLNTKAAIGNTLQGVGVASGAVGVGAMTGAITNSAALGAYGTAMSTLFVSRQVMNQLKFFKTTYYTNKMIKELEPCQDKEQCLKIIENYCYQITTKINGTIQKSKKQIPYDVQQDMLMKFYTPLKNIIMNNNPYWHMQMMDYVKSDKIQSVVQHVCNTALTYLMPKVIRSGMNSNLKVPNSVGKAAAKIVGK